MVNYITGSKGFIGSHLLPKLKGDVVAIEHEYIQQTTIQPFDYFYFLSSYGNLASHQDEDAIYKANIEDLLYVLRQIKNYKFKSFVFISTSSVSLRQQTTYSRTKRAAEEILLAFMEKYDLPICIIRPYSVIGVGEQKEHLIPLLIEAAFSGKEMKFVPAPVHDLIDVDDVVAGIQSLANHGARGFYQLGTGRGTRNDEVLDLVQRITGKKINVEEVESLRAYDNKEWVSTNFRARSFGWLPRKTLTETITAMVGDYVYEQTGAGV